MSESRLSFVMISELSFDWISLSVIWSVFLLSIASFCIRLFACSIFPFICDSVAIICLYVSCYSALSSSSSPSPFSASGEGA